MFIISKRLREGLIQLATVLLLIDDVENKIFPSHVANAVKYSASKFQEIREFDSWGTQPCSTQCALNGQCAAFAITNGNAYSEKINCILLEKVDGEINSEAACQDCQIFEMGPVSIRHKETFSNSHCGASAMFTHEDDDGDNFAYVFCKNNFVYKIKEGSFDDIIKREHVTTFFQDFAAVKVDIATDIGHGAIIIASADNWMFYEPAPKGKKLSMVKADNHCLPKELQHRVFSFATRVNSDYILFVITDDSYVCLKENDFFCSSQDMDRWDNDISRRFRNTLHGNFTHFQNGTARRPAGKPPHKGANKMSTTSSYPYKGNKGITSPGMAREDSGEDGLGKDNKDSGEKRQEKDNEDSGENREGKGNEDSGENRPRRDNGDSGENRPGIDIDDSEENRLGRDNEDSGKNRPGKVNGDLGENRSRKVKRDSDENRQGKAIDQSGESRPGQIKGSREGGPQRDIGGKQSFSEHDNKGYTKKYGENQANTSEVKYDLLKDCRRKGEMLMKVQTMAVDQFYGKYYDVDDSIIRAIYMEDF